MRFVGIILAFVMVHGTCTAQQAPSTISVIEQMTSDIADSLLVVAGPRVDTAEIFVHDHPDASWFASIIAQRWTERGIPTRMADSLRATSLALVVMNASTFYEQTAALDTVTRTVTVAFSASKGGRVFRLPQQVRTDICDRESARALESRQHTSTHADMPPRQASFWEEFLQPAIFVAAAVVTIALLFTVRSQ